MIRLEIPVIPYPGIPRAFQAVGKWPADVLSAQIQNPLTLSDSRT